MILHIDFETTGLPIRGAQSNDPRHPWPVSVAAILDDEDGKMRACYYSLIQLHNEVEFSPEAAAVNGLTREICNRFGSPLQEVMGKLTALAQHADTIAAFSHHFDMKFLKIGCARVMGGDEMRAIFEAKQKFCTMEASARHIKGPGERFIKLEIAHKELLGVGFPGAHNALADCNASRKVYYKLKELGADDGAPTQAVTNRVETPL